MKQRILAVTIIILAVLSIQACAAITITVDSAIGILTNSKDGTEIKNMNVQMEEDGRANVYFSQPNDYPREENLETWGSIMLSSDEGKPVKVYLDKKVNVEFSNMPDKYEFTIYSEEKHCYKETINTDEFIFSDIFFTYFDEITTRNFAYLPDFTDSYEINLRAKINKQMTIYEYGPVVLKNDDTITIDEFEIYINGKKIERKIYEPGFSLTAVKCFSFSEGTTILNFTDDISNDITITVNSPEGYLLWRDNLRKELNNYECLNDPYTKSKQFTSIELTQDSSSTSLNRGILAFSNEETKPININMNRRIGIDLKNLPKGHSAKIYSEEAVCDEGGKQLQEIFHATLNPALDKSFYLPDFTNNFKMIIWTLDSKHMQKGYLYDLPELKYGYIIQVKEFDILVNGKEVQKQYFEKKGKEFPPFNCYTFSEDYSKPVDKNLTLNKVKKQLEIQVKDFYLDKPVERASVYFNKQLIGATSSKGIIEDEVLVKEENNELKITAAGYKPLVQEISGKETKISITLKPQYEPFEIPKGYESYVSTKKIYSWIKDEGKTETYKDYVTIHPSETKLRTYSFPITSNEKKTVLKQAISRVRSKESPMITYDDNCVPEIKKNCEAWHESDYKILEAEKGVCSDFATIAVSFANSYQIPARRVSVAYDVSNLIQKYIFKEKEYGYHAFAEVYLEEGWKNFDITWKLLDDTCAYANRGNCLVYAKIIDENKETDLTETYACNKLCDKEKIKEGTSSEKAPAQSGTDKNKLLIDMTSDNAKVQYRTILNKEESAKILEIQKSKTFNEIETAKEISKEIKQGFRQEITAINPIFVIDEKNKEQIEAGVDFEFKLPKDELTYTLNTYQEEYEIKLITPRNINAVLPSFNSKETGSDSITYRFSFKEPGEHTVHAIFKHKKSAVLSNDPIHKALADVLGNHIGAESYALEEQMPDAKRIYIIGDYSYVPVSYEEKLKEKNIEVIRFDYDDKYLSAQIAQGFWQSADEVVIANMYDYASVEQARGYAIEKDIPLIYISPEEIPEYVQKAIGFTGATKTTIKDPKNKINATTDTIAQEEKSTNNTKIIIATAIILAIATAILLAYKFVKKPNKKSQSKKKR